MSRERIGAGFYSNGEALSSKVSSDIAQIIHNVTHDFSTDARRPLAATSTPSTRATPIATVSS